MFSINQHTTEIETATPPQRIAEVSARLRKRIAPEEVISRLDAVDTGAAEGSGIMLSLFQNCIWGLIFIVTGMWALWLFDKVTAVPRPSAAESFRTWIADYDLTVDELWEYDNDRWETLGGDCGYAVVRRGIVVDYWMHCVS